MATLNSQSPVNTDLFGSFTLNPSNLSVAKENFTASKPPIRSLDVTNEILSMLQSQGVKETLNQIFDEHTQHKIDSKTLPFMRRTK